jgi:hypothetical protein
MDDHPGVRTRNPKMIVFDTDHGPRCLSNSLILSMAATTPKLQHLVPDIDSILRETPDRIQPWASRDSSAEAVGLILRTLHHKMKFYTSKAR